MQPRKNEVDRYWQTAGDRVFLYLRCLNFPPAQTLELSLRTLKKAEQNISNDDSRDDPVAEAMEVLLELLHTIGGENILSYRCERKWMKNTEAEDISSSRDHSRAAASVSSMPPIRRLHMTPEELSPTSLSELFKNFTRRTKKNSGK